MSQGHWRYSPGTDTWARGLYQECKGTDDNGDPAEDWRYVGPLPYVTERLTRRDGDGRRKGVELRLTMDPTGHDSAIVDVEDVRKGAWASKLDVPVSADKKITDALATAVLQISYLNNVEVREAAPRWVRGELRYPPADVGPPGYLRHAGDEERARQAWRDLADIAACSPKLALVAGAAFGGLFVGALKRQSYIVQMVGEARQGKTTALTLAGAILGDPGECHESEDGFDVGGGLVEPWNTSPVGLIQHMGDLGVYPALFDEIGAAGLTSTRKEQLIFQLTEGAQRRTGGKSGRGSKSAPWRGVLISTGNESITSGVLNEGAYARVVEIPTPLTLNMADAERVPELVSLGYGWPLQWALRSGLDVDAMRAATLRAEQAVGIPDGGVPRTLAKHLGLAIAGAEWLSALIGGTDLATPATNAGSELLAAMMAEIAERGLTPGQRLLSAVEQAVASRPRAFPTIDEYRKSLRGESSGLDRPPILPPVIDGVALPQEPGDRIAVFVERLRVVAGEAGIDDVTQGLRQLRDTGTLVTSGESDGRLRKDLRIMGRKSSAYVFQLASPEQSPEQSPEEVSPVAPAGTGDTDRGPGTPTGDTLPTTGDTPSTRENSLDRGSAVATVPGHPPVGVPGSVPGRATAPGTPGDTTREAVTRENAPNGASRTPGVPGVPGHEKQSRRENSDVLALGCADDGIYLGRRDGLPRVDPGDAYSGMGSFLTMCARYLPDGGTVAITEEVASSLGYPETSPHRANDRRKRAKAAETPRAITEAEAAGWKCSESGIKAWTTWRRESGPGWVVVVLPWANPRETGTSGETMINHDDDLLTATYMFARFRELAPANVPFAMTAGSSATQMIFREYKRPDGTSVERGRRTPLFRSSYPSDSPMAKANEQGLLWTHSEIPDTGYVHGYDAVMMHLSAMLSSDFATNALSDVGEVLFDPDQPGYWEIPGGEHRLSPDGPPLVGSGRRPRDLPQWVTTATAKLLIQHDLLDPMEPRNAWLPCNRSGEPSGGVRLMRELSERLRDAVLSIPRTETASDEKRVREALKASYQEMAGMLTRGTPFVQRADWGHTIVSTARANLLRKVIRVWHYTGRWPVKIDHDCVYYASEEIDPRDANPAPNVIKVLDEDAQPKLGWFTVKFSEPVSVFAEKELRK